MRIALCAALVALAACTSHEGRTETKTVVADPLVTPKTPSTPQIAVRGAIASVSMIQNCSDDEPYSPPPPPAAIEQSPAAAMPQGISAGASAKPGGGGPGFRQPCTQSSMQINLAHDAREAQTIEVRAVRLTAAGTGAQLGSVPFRAPTRWDEAGRYVAWDQSVPAAQEIKASYKLGEPDWSAIGKAVGNDDTYAPRYVLEVDVALGDRIITLRSNEFQREHPHVIVT
jgi:hypothetical protein